MLTLLITTAVIAQPLDATYSTEGHPKSAGMHLSLKYPASWIRDKAAEEKIPYAVAVLGDEKDTACTLHVQDVSGDPQVAMRTAAEAEQYIFNNMLGEGAFVPKWTTTSSRRAIRSGGVTFQLVEYFGVLNGSAMRGRLYLRVFGKRVVCLRCGCVSDYGSQSDCDRVFAEHSALFDRMFQSLADKTPKKKPKGFFTATKIWVLVACAIAAVLLYGWHVDRLIRAGKIKL